MSELNFEENLKKEISPQDASVTGYFISCAIETEKGIYFDHNIEDPETLAFHHAEERALLKVFKNESLPKIKQIVMYGEGKVKKSKHYVPCMYCAQKLSHYTNSETTIKLLPVSRLGPALSLNFAEVLESYHTLEESNLYAPDRDEMNIILNSDTTLNKIDREFILDLVSLCQKDDISLYLTGSASGRGGFSTFLLSKNGESYKDIDLFFVLNGKQDWEIALGEIKRLVDSTYGQLSLFFRDIPPYQNRKGVVLGKAYFYKDDETEPLIDMTFSTKLEGSFIRSEYEKNNWFHQLTPSKYL